MLFDTESRLYYKQYDLECDVRGNGDTVHKADRMKLDLFFDPFRRAAEQTELVNCTKMLNLRSEVEGDAFSDQSRVLAVKMHATMEIVRQSGGFLYERGESRVSVPQIGGGCRTKRFKSMGRYGGEWVSRTKLATKAGGGGGSSGTGGGTI